MTAFTYKGYGRIYTNSEHIEDVEYIIQKLDEFEWDYYPKGLVASWDTYPHVEYVGKFELNKEKFKELCKKANIPFFIGNSGMNDHPLGYHLTGSLSKGEIEALSYGELE